MKEPVIDVALISDVAKAYPEQAPFHPSEAFPELSFAGAASAPNPIYAAVRQLLLDLGLDREHAGTAAWNPLRDFAPAGGTVVIKPNMVLDRHLRGGDLQALVTHGSVVRPLVDYACLAVGPGGAVIVGDSPLQTTDFEGVVGATGIREVVEWHRSQGRSQVTLADFRRVVSTREPSGHIIGWKDQAGDPRGYVEYDLGEASVLHSIEQDSDRFRVSNYKAEETQANHAPGRHRYVIARSIADADLVISVPKLKTHCKVGVTLSMKNFVGTVGLKQCLAHHREGGAGGRGDEYPGRSALKYVSQRLEGWIDGAPAGARRSLLKLVYRVNERLIRIFHVNPIRDGGWHGNDTCWRMTQDLVRIALYGKNDGRLAGKAQRRILSVIDGVVGGDGEGPLEAAPVRSGILLAGLDPARTDVVGATCMGMAWRKISLLREAFLPREFPLGSEGGWQDEVERLLKISGRTGASHPRVMSLADLRDSSYISQFQPPRGWVGRMELDRTQERPDVS